jgi:multicomponent Na+:H+ antiporter subunit G
MSAAFEVLSAVLILLGLFFALTGAVGVWKFPDFYSRLHPAGCIDTLGQSLILLALIFRSFQQPGFGINGAVKLVFIIIFIFVTAPTAVHAIVKAAHLDGLNPWRKGKADDGL